MTKALTNSTYDSRLLEKGIKYTRVGNYINSRTKILHFCPVCASTWEATPGSILQGSGCGNCTTNIKKHTNESYDAKLLEKGIKYKRIGEYKTAHTSIEHQCPTCGNIWKVSPSNVSQGRGCPICALKATSFSNTTYDAKLLEKGIKYKRVGEYKNAHTSIEHQCPDCSSIWSPRPCHILNGSGCPYCAGLLKYTDKSYDTKLIEKDIKYKRLGKYINSKEKISHQCQLCGNVWDTRPNDILNGIGCPVCAKSQQTSKAERELGIYIQSIYTGWIEFSDRSILKGKELDIVLPDLGLAFEYNGVYWHREDVKGKNYHLNKTTAVENFGYQLIHVNEYEWQTKQPIVRSRIKALLGFSNKIYARKCTIKEVDSIEAASFLNVNHIQGNCISKYRYGLYLGDNLVSLMTFGTPRFNSNYTYELIRYCSILDHTVIGGASKLLKAFRTLHSGSILSYADKRWSKGNLYSKLGFTFSHNSAPNYRYYKDTDSLSRQQCQKHKLVEQGYDPKLTEKEIMKERGYHAMYDSGNSVWVLE